MCVRGFMHCGCDRQVASPVVTIPVGVPRRGEAHPPSCIDGVERMPGLGACPHASRAPGCPDNGRGLLLMMPLFRFNCCGRGRASRSRIDNAVHRECPCDGHGGAGPSTEPGAADTDGYAAVHGVVLGRRLPSPSPMVPAARTAIDSPSAPAGQVVRLSLIPWIRWKAASMRIRLTASWVSDRLGVRVDDAAAGVSSGPEGVFECVCCCTTVRPRVTPWGAIREDSSGRPDPRGRVDRNRFMRSQCMQHRPSPLRPRNTGPGRGAD
jgi:hypothetical protein